MRILLMCEGTNEETLISALLDANAFKFTKDDLIGLKPYAVRDLNYIKSELKLYGKPVKIYRIGDTQTDKLSIPKELNGIVNKKDIYNGNSGIIYKFEVIPSYVTCVTPSPPRRRL